MIAAVRGLLAGFLLNLALKVAPPEWDVWEMWDDEVIAADRELIAENERLRQEAEAARREFDEAFP